MSPQLQRAYDALEQADAAGNTEDAQQLADYIRELEAQQSTAGDMMKPVAGLVGGALTGAITGPAVGKVVDMATIRAAEQMAGPKGTPRGDSVAKWLATQTTGPNVGGATFEEAFKKSEIARGVPVQSRGSKIPIRKGFLGIENQPEAPSFSQKAAANLVSGEKLGTPGIPRRVAGMGVMGAETGKMISDIERGDTGSAILSGIGAAGGAMSQSRIKPIRALGTGLSLLVPGAQGASAVKDVLYSPELSEEKKKEEKAQGGLVGYAPGGKIAKSALDALKKASEGKMGQVANKDLVTLQDFHTSLGDRIAASVKAKQDLIANTNYKYNVGDVVMTPWTVEKNYPPMTILGKTIYGGDRSAFLRDPKTGKVLLDEQGNKLREPQRPGYRVKHEFTHPEQGNISHEYVLPEERFLGTINPEEPYKEGGSTTPAWQRKEGKNPEGGLNALGRASYKRETGGELKAPQPEGGSRKKSFCARMGGMKKKLTSSKTANDPDSRINKALRKWKC